MASLNPVIFTVLSVALITFGAAYGISKIASKACDSIARQPEAGSKIQAAMVVAIALIEGVALFSCVICLLSLFFK